MPHQSSDMANTNNNDAIEMLAKQNDIFQTILKIIERAITSARERKANPELADLLLCQGVALAGYSSEENRHESALTRWTEGYALGLESGLWYYCARLAVDFVFNYHFSKVRTEQTAAHEIEIHVEKVEAMAESTSSPEVAPGLRLMLANLYTRLEKHDAAQKLLLNDLKTGFDLLSDNDPENDDLGFATIAKILMHTGDDLSALSAWSLYGPMERRREYIAKEAQDSKEAHSQGEVSPSSGDSIENVSRICNGHCSGEDLSWEESVWMCKVCDDVDFNDDCLEKLRKCTLPLLTCSPDHEWLLVPSWADEYRATGKGRVRIGGELIDGKRVGGQILPVEEWLDIVRKEWGVDKPSLTIPNDNDKSNQ